MKTLARLACIAFALAGSSAWAQIVVSEVEDTNHCKKMMVTNSSDHKWVVSIPHHYAGVTSDGTPWTNDWETAVTVYPRSTAYTWTASGLVDCTKPYRFTFQWRGQDQTAIEEAEAKRINDSREAVIRAELERQAEVKRLNDERQRRLEAEAAAKQAAADARAAASAKAKQDMLNMQAQQESQRRAEEQRLIAAGDPRCRTFTLADYNKCKMRIDAEDQQSAQVNSARAKIIASIDPRMCASPGYGSVGSAEDMRQTQLAIENALAACRANRQSIDVVSRTGLKVSPINPQTCASPGWGGNVQTDADRRDVQAYIDQLIAQCRQGQAGVMAANQQAQMFAAQQAAEQAAIAAQAEAQRRAEAQRQLDSTIAASRAEIQNTNADFKQQSQDLQQSNAELEAWLNSH